MSYEILQNELKNNIVRNIYVFYGPEEYLKDYYINKIESLILDESLKAFNKVVLANNEDQHQIIKACETMPAFSSKKLVIVKSSAIFKAPKDSNKNSKSKSELSAYLENIPDYNCVIFCTDNIDKRMKIVNVIKKNGLLVEFENKKPMELVSWIKKVCKNNGKDIDNDAAMCIVEYCEPDMYSILNEVNKLVLFAIDKTKIIKQDVKDLCVKTMKSRIFDLTDAIVQKDPKTSIKIFEELVSTKEPIPKIFFMITKHFKQILEIKFLNNEGFNINEIIKRIGISPYAAKKILTQSNRFSVPALKEILVECLNLDVAIKTGKTKPNLALEYLIINLSTAG